MSRYLRKKYMKLEAYVPGEQPKDMAYTKLNTNESPYPPGPRTIKAVSNDEVARLRLYSDPDSTALKDAIAKRYGMTRQNIYVSNGSDDILNFAFMAFADERMGVMFPEISYGFYKVFAEFHGVKYEMVPLKENFSIDPRDYYQKHKLIVIANPNAPTGKALTRQQIEQIVMTNTESVVVIDEAYVDFGAESAVELVHRYDNLLVVQTFSKSRSLAGARLGFAIAQPALISDLERIKYSTNPYNVGRLPSTVGIAAIEEDDYYKANCQKIMKTRAKVTAELEAEGFKVVPSLANFIFAASPDIGGEELYMKLKDEGVLIRHFTADNIKDYNRITIGSEEEMIILLDAIRKIKGEMA